MLLIHFIRGTCPCSIERKCENPNLWCNCDDIEDDKWNSDEGYYTTGNSLGITQMVFLQQHDLKEDALGRITLGPLECVETSNLTMGKKIPELLYLLQIHSDMLLLLRLANHTLRFQVGEKEI